MDKNIIFSMMGVSKTLPNSNKTIIKDIHLSFFYGAKIGIIGLNGSGKSTLLKIIAGVDPNYQGRVEFQKGYTVGFLEQEPALDETKTVKDIVSEGVQETMDILAEYEKVNEAMGLEENYMDPDKMDKLLQKQGSLGEKIDLVNGWEIDSVLDRAMGALKCPEPDKSIAVCSGGEKRRVALCRLLLKNPDILLLDEPTNHLDAESVHWLEQHLARYKGTVIAVTHDRYFLDNVAGWILELDRGEGIPWEGNYSSWLEQKRKRLATEEKQESKRQKALQRELEWVRMNPKGRQAKAKARLANYEKMASEEAKSKEARLEIFIPGGPRLGNNVINAEHLYKGYGEQLLIEDLSFQLPPAGIVGVIGPNGAGKTTLFRMIMGNEQPDKGSIEIGETVQIGYVDQSHEDIQPDKTVFEVVSNGNDFIELGNTSINSRAYLARFNFTGSDQEKKCGVLSGGERNRLHLAMCLKQQANVLLLDEPTNDIDINTLRALEEAIENFPGCAVIISHDRWFLDRVATHILAFEGDAQVYFFEGGYTDYEENRRKRLGEVGSKKFKYKKLVADG
ncbi:MAG: energy-dependent translational throttle protein EttA [Saprospirales bacterium]|nr:MAG: energy-dependent translational throttle protein EttA [Saprospirales bacterium]